MDLVIDATKHPRNLNTDGNRLSSMACPIMSWFLNWPHYLSGWVRTQITDQPGDHLHNQEHLLDCKLFFFFFF